MRPVLRVSSARCLAGVADAELVALRVGHEDPVGAVLVDVVVANASGTEGFEAGGFGFDVGGLDVEVHAVLDDLGFGKAALTKNQASGAIACSATKAWRRSDALMGWIPKI